MKPLLAAAADYLALRRALGFKLRHETWWLPDFVAYLSSHGSTTITTELALRWAQQPADADPSWWAKKLGAIRRFARYHHACDPRTEVPPADLLPFRARRQTPHIYSDEEFAALLQEARRLPDPLTSASYTTLLGLLAATGMRVGEALGLDQQDIDWRQSLLTVRHSKFGKTRQVPVHPSTITALHEYVQARDRLCPRRRTPSFFISRVGTRVIHQNFHHVFLRLIRLSGIGAGPRHRPRLHDLRHSFAVKTLRDWYRAGVDVEQRLPWLSTYLGHVNPTTTYWYLTATPELLALAADRLERAWKVQS
jgi:integrase